MYFFYQHEIINVFFHFLIFRRKFNRPCLLSWHRSSSRMPSKKTTNCYTRAWADCLTKLSCMYSSVALLSHFAKCKNRKCENKKCEIFYCISRWFRQFKAFWAILVFSHFLFSHFRFLHFESAKIKSANKQVWLKMLKIA